MKEQFNLEIKVILQNSSSENHKGTNRLMEKFEYYKIVLETTEQQKLVVGWIFKSMCHNSLKY